MRQRKSRVCGRRVSACCKLRLLLTETEAERLDDSTARSGACSRALLIVEALRAGLANPDRTLSRGERRVRVDAWVPTGLVVGLKRLAAIHHLTQQHLLRLFLFQYLAAAPWERNQTENESKSEGVLRQ